MRSANHDLLEQIESRRTDGHLSFDLVDPLLDALATQEQTIVSCQRHSERVEQRAQRYRKVYVTVKTIFARWRRVDGLWMIRALIDELSEQVTKIERQEKR